ncbi:MAG: SH3 domain-containing protein [Bacillota bacterium]|nr:SH3 domain-containing protein [Bacillota bacterium]
MKRTKKIFVAGALVLGMASGALLFTPKGINASGNVVLASVDWVTSQLNPMNSKIADLEKKIASQQQDLSNLRAQINTMAANAQVQGQGQQLQSVVYTTKTAAIRSGANVHYKIIATKTVGSSLKVIDSVTLSTGLWYRVELSSTLKGWIAATDISLVKNSSANANASDTKISVTSQASVTPKQVIITKSVTLRKGASDSYPANATIQAGKSVMYLQTFVNSKGETWLNVETPTHVRGWMLSGFGEVK